MARDIAFLLEIALEQFSHHPRLHLGPFHPPQLHQPVAVPRIASLASEAEIYASVFANGSQALDDHRRLLLAEPGLEVGSLVDSNLWRGGIQIEGEPSRGEGVVGGRMRSLVEGDAALQLLFADVAPWADVVGGDGDVKVCHFAEVGSQDDAGRFLWNARVWKTCYVF